MKTKTKKKVPSITTRVADANGASWLVMITHRAPRKGERATWLHSANLDEMLLEQLRPVLDEQGHVRPSFIKESGELRLGVLYTYDPEPRECVQGRARLATIVTTIAPVETPS